jgi:hypothetical protein
MEVKMSICWSCGCEITEENESKEHIIPNNLFGKQKPKTLLCKTCNTEYSKLDRSLGDDFKDIRSFIPTKKDRGKQPFIVVTSDDGTEYKVQNGIPKLNKPDFPKNPEKRIVDGKEQKVYNITTRDEEELNSMIKGLKRKYTDKEVFTEYKNEKEEYLGTLKYNSTILSDQNLRAVAKIAANFYTWKGGNRSEILDVIDYINGNSNKEYVGVYYPGNVSNGASYDISHVIYLRGDNNERILYCYIELFGAINFVVILNDEYDGENIEQHYRLNVETKDDCTEDFKLNLTKDEIEKIISCDIPTEQLKAHYGRIGNILVSKSAHRFIKSLIENILQDKAVDKDVFVSLWEEIGLKLNEYPNWDIWAYCAYHVEVWDQNNFKCSCGSTDHHFCLIGMNIKGNIPFVNLKIICKECGKMSEFESFPKRKSISKH